MQKGTTLQGVYQKLWAGRLPAEKVDGRWLIQVDEQPEQQERKAR